MEIAKKLSTKVLVGGRPDIPAKDATGDAKTNWVFEVAGLAQGIKSGESNFGPWSSLMGNFAARQLVKDDKGAYTYGKAYRTGQMFLPDVAMNLVEPVVSNLPRGDSVEFGFRIGVIRDDTAATGYTYVAESLIEMDKSDPLQKLMDKSFSKVPQIGTTAKTETETKK